MLENAIKPKKVKKKKKKQQHKITILDSGMSEPNFVHGELRFKNNKKIQNPIKS